MQHFERNKYNKRREEKRREEKSHYQPEKIAAQYLGSRYLHVFPHHCFSWLLIAGVRVYCGINTPKEILFHGIWEFFLVQETGLGGTFRVNNTIWYLSAFLIASFFVYYLLLKNKEVFIYVIGPVSIFVILSWFYHDMGYLGYANQYQFLICSGAWEAFAGLGYGCICYEVFKYITNRWGKYLKTHCVRIMASFFELCGFGFYIYYSWYGLQTKDFIIFFLLGLLIISVFTESSYITQLLNNRVSGACGKITFAIYLNQFIFIHLIQTKFPGHPFWPMTLCMVFAVILFSIFSTWFMETVEKSIRLRLIKRNTC